MPLFIDPKARERLYFPETFGEGETELPTMPEFAGAWIEVMQSISNATWQKLQAGAITAQQGAESADWSMAFSGDSGIRRAAEWIKATSFVDGAGAAYSPGNLADRERWLGAMFPPAYDQVVLVLDAYIQDAWAARSPNLHPKAEPSSDPTL